MPTNYVIARAGFTLSWAPGTLGFSQYFSVKYRRPKKVLYERGAPGTVVQVLTLLCVILYYYLLPSLSLRLLLLSIAIGAIELDSRMVFSLIPSCVLLAFGKINLTCLANAKPVPGYCITFMRACVSNCLDKNL